MKFTKIGNRIKAIILTVAVLVSVLPLSIISYADSTLFFDDFRTGTNWNMANASITSQAMLQNANTFNTVKTLKSFESITVSADVSVCVNKKENGFNVGMLPCVCARASKDGNQGYEFGIGISKSGVTFARLYRRNASGESQVLFQQSDSIDNFGKIKKNTVYNIKLTVADKKLYCSINGVKIAEISDSAFSNGYVGVRACNYDCKFDNFKVESVAKKTVENITVTSHSATVSKSGKLFFNGKITYNSVYGEEIFNQDTAGVTYTGIDGNPGQKKIKVSYGGKSTSFNVTVTKSYASKTVFEDDFSDNDISDWKGGKYNLEKDGVTVKEYKYYVKNKELYFNGADTCGMDKGINSITYHNLEGINNDDSYSVSVKGAILRNALTKSKRYGSVSVVFARNVSSNEYYEFRLSSSGKITVYRNGNQIFATNTKVVLGKEVLLGKYYNLSVNVYEDCAELFIDGNYIYTLTDFGDPDTYPYVGVRSVAGEVKFDDFRVKTLETKGYYGISKMIVTANTDKTDISKKVLHSFNTNAYVLRVYYSDGSIYPVKIKESMLSKYDKYSGKNQVIKINFGSKYVSVNYQYFSYLFYDDFELTASNRWKFSTNQYSKYSLTSNQLKLTYDSSQSEKGSFASAVSDGYEWSDYSVSADFYIDTKGNMNGMTRYMGLVARKQDSDKYEFRLQISPSGKIAGKLYRFNDGTATPLCNISEAKLKYCLGDGQTLSTGNLYNMRMDVLDNSIKLYFNHKQLLIYTDTSSDRLSKGTAGINCISSNMSVDNFCVKSIQHVSIKKIELSSSQNGLYYVWQGNGIDVWNNSLNVFYSDDTLETFPLRQEYLGEFDNNQIGEHKVSIKFENAEYHIKVIVRDRPDYIKKFKDMLAKFDKSVDSSNAGEFAKLKEYYNTLTPYEIQNLSKNEINKYKKLDNSNDLYETPELKNEIQLVNNEFLGDSISNWNSSVEGNSGKWFETNGMLYQAQNAYGRSATGWRCADVYGNITAVSADCYMLNKQMHMGIGINVGEDGYYHARITSTSVDEEDNPIYQLQLLKKSPTGHTKIEVLDTKVYNKPITSNQWFNIKMTAFDKTLKVYLDGECMITYEEPMNFYNIGYAGIRISNGDGLYDNVKIWGTKVSLSSKDKNIEPYVYTDDFNDEKAGTNPSHWIEETSSSSSKTTDDWKVYSKSGNNVYGTESAGKTYTFLHVFDDNPKISAKISAENLNRNSSFGFVIRNAPTYAYTKIIYDKSQNKWCIISQDALVDGEKVIYADKTFDFKEGNTYAVNLTAEDKKLVLKVDGKTVISSKSVTHIGYGRIGFCTENASMFVDDLKLTLSSGDIPQDGLLEYTMSYEENSGHLEIEALDSETHLIGIGGYMSTSTLYESKDAGTTWSNISDTNNYSGISRTSYTSLLKLRSGKTIQLRSKDFTVEETEDMVHWKAIGAILKPNEVRDELDQKLALSHVNSLTEVELSDGTLRIFMPVTFRKYSDTNSVLGHYTVVYFSDDGGKTWTRSNTTTKEILPGYTDDNEATWAESKIIGCSDGTLRMYYTRNALGCMQYTVSKDNGVTWEGLYQIPEVQLAKTSFAIYEDAFNRGTYYMVCCTGRSIFALGSLFPRNHNMLLRSKDGMNWEFLTHLEWMNDYESTQNGVQLYQLVDPSIYTSQKYIYITFGRSEYEYSEDDANAHQAQRLRYVRIEKDKLTSRKWDASTISDMSYPQKIEFSQAPQSKFGQGDLFNCIGTLKLTDFNGNVITEDISQGCTCYTEPNMFKLGMQKIKLIYKNGYDLSYNIEIVKNHKITWIIYGEGSIEPESKKIMEGISKEYTLVPDSGWKVSEADIDGETIKIKGDKIVLSNISKDITVSVYFRQKNIFDYVWFYIISGLLVAGGISLAAIIVKKKVAGGGKKNEKE